MTDDIKGTIIAAAQDNREIHRLLRQAQRLKQSFDKAETQVLNRMSTTELIARMESSESVINSHEEVRKPALEFVELCRKSAATIAAASEGWGSDAIGDWLLLGENLDAVLKDLRRKHPWWRWWE